MSILIFIHLYLVYSSGYMPSLPGIDQLRRRELMVSPAADRRRSRHRFLRHRRVEGTPETDGRSVSAAAATRRYNRSGGRGRQDAGKDGGRSHRHHGRSQPAWHELERVFEYQHCTIGYSGGE